MANRCAICNEMISEKDYKKHLTECRDNVDYDLQYAIINFKSPHE